MAKLEKEVQENSKEDEIVNEMCDQVINDLRELRENKGVTTAKLSELTGIAQPNLTRMETGKVVPTIKTLAKIAYVLGAKITITDTES